LNEDPIKENGFELGPRDAVDTAKNINIWLLIGHV
jgi:hypothetical protein